MKGNREINEYRIKRPGDRKKGPEEEEGRR
jgi:hypothetical protein